MCKAIINTCIVAQVFEERFKSDESGFLLANLIKVSPFQAGKKTRNTSKDSTFFYRNQRTMENKACSNRSSAGMMLS